MFNKLDLGGSWSGRKLIFTSWEVDHIGVDLVGVDLMGVDLVGGHHKSILVCAHEISFHEINSHLVNSYQINFLWNQLLWDQLQQSQLLLLQNQFNSWNQLFELLVHAKAWQVWVSWQALISVLVCRQASPKHLCMVTQREEAVTKPRFRASGLELQVGHDAVWRKRRRGYRLFLTASMQVTSPSMNT